jgi:hypothetical protein
LIDRYGDRLRGGVAIISNVNGNRFSLHAPIFCYRKLPWVAAPAFSRCTSLFFSAC